LPGLITETPARSYHHEEAWKPWLAAGLWLGLIAFESTTWLSSEHTGSLLYYWLVRLFGPINPIAFETFHHYLRKTGHVFGYAMLSFLLFRAWRATLPKIDLARWSMRWAGIAWLMTALVASLDEWHQSYFPSRTGTIRDVFLDIAAALAMQIMLWLYLRGRTFDISRQQQ
jgi:VanZ family protein